MIVMYKVRQFFSLVLMASLAACGTQMDELQNVGKAPAMEKVEVPMAKQTYVPLEWDEGTDEEEAAQPSYANSLWQPGARAFFKDMKARRVGDILKVTIKIKDKAELDNATQRSRTAKEESAALKVLGLENKIIGLIPGVADPASLLNIDASGNSKGSGTIARGETIETEVAAMVTQILPNGNLVVHADQEIRVNFEVRKVTVDGIVRQEDISADNSVDSTQIAEARISYGGRGQITNVQQPRIGNQVIDIISPF